jgi:hypothetical protein
MPTLLELITKRLRGSSFFETTRDMIAETTRTLPEIVLGAEDYLGRVPGQIAAATGQPALHQSVVDLRLGTEFLVLKLSRLIPILSAIMADLYGSDIVGMRRAARVDALWNERVAALGDRLQALNVTWERLTTRRATDDRTEILWLLDAAPLLAEAYALATNLLAELLRAEVEGSEDVDDGSDAPS